MSQNHWKWFEGCGFHAREGHGNSLMVPIIFVVRGGIMFVCFSSFGFVVKRLISCFFLGVVSLLVFDFFFHYHL